MLGTGVYLALGLAAGIAGYFIFISILLASFLALCNGFSSAQLASNHPTSGGTYEFGRIYLNKEIGFMAGWVFIFAKGASAAAACLAITGYIKHYLNIETPHFSTYFPVLIIIFMWLIVQLGRRGLTPGPQGAVASGR